MSEFSPVLNTINAYIYIFHPRDTYSDIVKGISRLIFSFLNECPLPTFLFLWGFFPTQSVYSYWWVRTKHKIQ